MRKLVSLVPCIVFALATFGQLSSLKGTIRDTTEKKSLPRSVISLLRTKDSVLVAFTRADAQGHFKLDGLNPAEYLLLVTYPKFADYADRLQLPPGVTDLGVLPLTPRSVLLQEVVIRNNRAINIKGDTTEFLADSFKVKEGATVEDLLKQIPGIQVNSKGEITAQGKRVDKVLVDGEEFFGADPTIATQNIAAKAVDKVQVFETKSEQDQLKGIGATADANKTINIKLKESAKKGYFGKAEAGSDFDRLLNGKLMFNRFRGNQKLSVYGTKSNTNTGSLGWEDQNKLGLDDNDYEYDEISGFFFSYGNSDNEFNDWTLRGLPKAYTAGGLYGNKWGEDKNKTNLSYLYNRLGTTNQTTTVSQTLLKDTTFFNNSRSSSQGLSQRHTATGKYEWKPDSLTTIKFNISGKYNLKPVVTVIPWLSDAGQRVVGYVGWSIASTATRVSVQDSGMPVKATMPDANGMFVLHPIPVGSYTLVSSKRISATVFEYAYRAQVTNAGVALKNVVDAYPGSALLGVHHTRKASSDDFVDDLSGTLGLAGSADYVLVLRRQRNSADANLQITGRDAPEGEYAFTIAGGTWTLAGDGLPAAAAEAQIRRERRNLGDRAQQALDFVNAHPAGVSPEDVAKHLNISANDAGTYLRRLHDKGCIHRPARGVYTPSATASEVSEVSFPQVVRPE